MDTTLAAWLVIVTGLITGIGGLVTAVYTARTAAKESELKRVSLIIDELQEQNTRLLARVKQLEKESFAYQRWASRLVKQVIHLGGVPEKLEENGEGKVK
jgi:uncharacterized protein YlxW (UPF0749 family)